MKKLLVLLALCMVLSVVLVACTEDTPTDETTDVTTEAPGTDAPTEAPGTDDPTEGTTESPTTEEPTTEAPTTEAPTTQEPTTEVPVPDPDPVTTHLSFDELDKWIDISGDITNSANSLGSIFTPGQSAGWDKIATVDDYTIAYLRVWGWVGFFAEEVGEFGYQIDDQEPVFSADFAVVAGDDVVQAAAGTGAKCASRMTIMIPVRDLSGEHTIKALVKDAVGTIEELTVFTLNKAVDPDAPVFMLTPDVIATTGTGAPDVASATLSDDGSFVTLVNGTVGDPYITFRQMNCNVRYVAVKYRTTVEGASFNYFAASTGTDATGQGDQLGSQMYTTDGMWHVAITDLDPAEAINEEWALSFLRYDFYQNGTEQAIDVAYIAGFNSIEAAEAYFAKTMLVADNTNTFVSDISGAEVGTAINSTDLVNFFTMNMPTGGSNVVEVNGTKAYEMASINEMIADVNGANFVKVNVISGTTTATVFTRGYQVVNSDAVIAAFDPAAGIYKINNYYETDGNPSSCGGAGIYANIVDGQLFIMVKYYNAENTTRVGNATFFIPCEGSELVLADNGYTVSVLVNGGTYATIDLIGAQSYADINEVSPAGQFAAKAVVTLKDGTTQTITDTLVAAAPSQVGVVARTGGIKFSSVEVGGYTAIEVPAIEIVNPDPVDPNAPVSKVQAGMIGESCDSILQNNNLYFGEDGGAYSKLEGVNNTITLQAGDVLGIRGWIGFSQPIEQFGLIVNGGEFMGGDFAQVPEDVIYTLAGEHAFRYHITLDTTGAPAGEYSVMWGAKLADGTIVKFYTITVILEGAEEPAPEEPAVTEATISFADLSYRTEDGGEDYQVFSNNGFTYTHNKGESTNGVKVDQYNDPIRLYVSHVVTFEFTGMTKLVVTLEESKGTDGFATAIDDANATVTVDGVVVTVEFTEPVDSFSVVINKQVRMFSATAYNN